MQKTRRIELPVKVRQEVEEGEEVGIAVKLRVKFKFGEKVDVYLPL